MSELRTIARPYAKAAFEIARNQGELEKWQNMIGAFSSAAIKPKLTAVLRDPALSAKKKASTLFEVCSEATTSEVCSEATTRQGKAFLIALAENNRLTLLPTIHELFHQLKLNFEKAVDIESTSAFKITTEQSRTLLVLFEKKLGKTVNLISKTDPGLIGGIIIRVGDLTIDGSVRGKLEKLAEAVKS